PTSSPASHAALAPRGKWPAARKPGGVVTDVYPQADPGTARNPRVSHVRAVSGATFGPTDLHLPGPRRYHQGTNRRYPAPNTVSGASNNLNEEVGGCGRTRSPKSASV